MARICILLLSLAVAALARLVSSAVIGMNASARVKSRQPRGQE